jgi:hypothetical protein
MDDIQSGKSAKSQVSRYQYDNNVLRLNDNNLYLKPEGFGISTIRDSRIVIKILVNLHIFFGK